MDLNPYAAPREDLVVPVAAYRGGMLPAAVEEARRRLEEHLAHRANAEADRRLIGPRLRAATWVMVGLVAAAAAVVALLAIPAAHVDGVVIGVAAGFAVVFAMLCGLLVFQDVRLTRGPHGGAPDAVVKTFFRALVLRPGLAVACLCPTGREIVVSPPVVPPVKLGAGSFRVSTPAEAKNYARTFCRQGDGQIRTLRVKSATVREIRGDVAIVDVDLAFLSFPQWAQILCVIAFVAVRLVGILLICLLYFPLRKRAVARTTKALLRGSDGAWYLLDPSVLEASPI